MPKGFALGATSGKIEGTTTQEGQFNFTIRVVDSSLPNPVSTTQAFRLTVSGTELDKYGGLVGAPSPGGATGYFRVEKAGNRWLFVSPEGHYMWLLAVYAMDPAEGGAGHKHAVLAKYPSSSVWAQQSVARAKSWGFNAIGPYAALGGWNALPVSTHGSPANLEKLPFIRHLDLSNWCQRSSTFLTKNLYNGLNPAVVSIDRMFPDVFDPQWVSCANAFAATGNNVFTPNLSPSEPWMIGTWIGDTDFLYGFNRGPATPASSAAPHLGWIAAATNPNLTSGPGSGFSPLTYLDTVVYTKQQWQNYLQKKYGTIAALNAGWGSNYTTFGSNGGWPKKTTGGTGLLDEDGSSPWMGNGSSDIVGANANAKVDMDNLLAQIATQYYKTAANACKVAYPNHLVFGSGSLNAQTYTQVLQAAGQYLDVLETWAEPAYISGLANAYNISGKPMIAWTTQTSQEDTEAKGGTPWGTGACTGDYDYCTQDLRGQGYAALIQNYWDTQGADGSYPVMGIDWWEWTDKVMGGENMNFGLVSQSDNAYDGQEDQVSGGMDSWGYSVGREPRNHGDFLRTVIQTNLNIPRALVTASKKVEARQPRAARPERISPQRILTGIP